MASMAPTPEVLSNGLAFLQIDLVDPEFHAFAHAHSRQMRSEIKKLLDDAVKAGELVATDTARLAQAVASMLNGSLLQWAIDRDGTAAKRLEVDLETLLTPLTARGRKKHARRSRKAP